MVYLVSFYYPPEGTPGANRFSHLARILCARYGKDRVRVVTGRPNYPHGILPREFRWKVFRRTQGQWGETVHHLYELPAPFKGLYRKTLGMVTFAVSVLIYFLFRRLKREDLVIVTSGPVFPAYAVHLASLVRSFRYVIDVRDLWPQIVAGMGFLSHHSAVYRALMRWSDAAYRRAVLGIGTTEGICEHLSAARPGLPVELIYNPVDLDLFTPPADPDLKRFRAAHADVFGRHDGPVLLYAGSFSLTTDTLQILRAAAAVPSSLDPFTVVMIGYGEQYDAMRAFVEENRIQHRVVFLPFMPREELVQYVSCADACLSCTSPSEINRIAIPTKLIEYLACNRFVVLALDTPFSKELERRGNALVAAPGDTRGLADCLCRFLSRRTEYLSGVTSRAYAIERFSLARFEQRMLTCVSRLVDPTQPPK